MSTTARLTALCLLAVGAGCANPDAAYDPDWDPSSVVAGGKADGLFDAVPELAIGGEASGDVGGDRLELYRMSLARTDRIEVTLTVTSGDLNPHLSLYYGTSVYVSSDDWSREGASLRKTYTAESAGTYLLAVRAYRGEGEGDYTLAVRCVGGPCAGELPPPDPEAGLEVDDVASCISQARRCALDRLPRYDGRVGDARAELLMQECLAEASLADGTSCASACEWVNPADAGDSAAGLCGSVVAALPFYADQSTECLAVLDGCMADCYAAGADNWDEELWSTNESLCWENGFNGTCDSFARGHAACGGAIAADSAGECTELCHATTGAFIDDLDTLCSSDSTCDDYCDVDLGAAAVACGGLSSSNEACLRGYLDDHSAWLCESALDDQLAGAAPAVSCSYSAPSTVGETSGELSASAVARGEITSASSVDDLTARQIVQAAVHLEMVSAGATLSDAIDAVDDGTFYLFDVTLDGARYDWVKAYAGDTEIGVVFQAGTLRAVAEVGDGDIMGCTLD